MAASGGQRGPKKGTPRPPPVTRAEEIVFLDGLRRGLSFEVAAGERSGVTFYGRARRNAAFREEIEVARARADIRWDEAWALVPRGHSIFSACMAVGISKGSYRTVRERDPAAMRLKELELQAGTLGSDRALIRDALVEAKDWVGLMRWYKQFMPHLLPNQK